MPLRHRDIFVRRHLDGAELGVEQPHLIHVSLVQEALGAKAAKRAKVQVAVSPRVHGAGTARLETDGAAVEVKLDNAHSRRHRDVVPLTANHRLRGRGDLRARLVVVRVRHRPETDRVGEVVSAASQSGTVARVAHQHHAPAEIAEHGDGLRANLLVGADPRLERQLLRLESGVEFRGAIDANSRARAVEVHRARTAARRKRR